jgi:nicotinate phosphoribosyltransferase
VEEVEANLLAVSHDAPESVRSESLGEHVGEVGRFASAGHRLLEDADRPGAREATEEDIDGDRAQGKAPDRLGAGAKPRHDRENDRRRQERPDHEVDDEDPCQLGTYSRERGEEEDPERVHEVEGHVDGRPEEEEAEEGAPREAADREPPEARGGGGEQGDREHGVSEDAADEERLDPRGISEGPVDVGEVRGEDEGEGRAAAVPARESRLCEGDSEKRMGEAVHGGKEGPRGELQWAPAALGGSAAISMDPARSPLLTDLYQLTMLQAYFEEGLEEEAVFEFFVRRLPPSRNFLLAAGLEPALDFLESFRFGPEDLEWVAADARFRPAFVERLAQLRFEGDVDAMPEGTAFFPDEPILRVVAPLPQAQVVESRLIQLLQFPTLVASKAARCVLATPGKSLVDFGMRRAHGAEAALLAARAAYLAGFDGTSTVLAAPRFGIPVYGTVAHSFVQAHDDEAESFLAFARSQPDNAVLLLDTYDTEAAARTVVRLAPRWKELGVSIRAVRLDSGDLAAHARSVRAILDEGGLRETRIFASGSLDEGILLELVRAGAPIDGFGVGTRLDVSADAPYLDCAYKLQAYAGRARRKRSEGKATWPGRKQVFRRHGADGRMAGDLLTLLGDRAEGEPLLRPMMRKGKRLEPPESLGDIRRRCADQLARLPDALRNLARAAPYPVEVSKALRELRDRLDESAP